MRWIAALILCGVAGQVGAAADLHRFSKAEIELIRVKCGLPKSELFLTGTGAVHLQPNRHQKIEKIDCALNAMKSYFPAKSVGLVGNERYEPKAR